MNQRFRRASLLTLALLAYTACDEETPAGESPASADAGSTHASATADVRDASSPLVGAAKPPTIGPASAIADAGPPPRVVDAGSAAPPSDAGPRGSTCSGCTSHESCDEARGQCVDKYQPWQLDCAHLPASTTCQGGPREVLLVTGSEGAVAMFDPGDGQSWATSRVRLWAATTTSCWRRRAPISASTCSTRPRTSSRAGRPTGRHEARSVFPATHSHSR